MRVLALQAPFAHMPWTSHSLAVGQVIEAHRSTAEGVGDGRLLGIGLGNASATSGHRNYYGGNWMGCTSQCNCMQLQEHTDGHAPRRAGQSIAGTDGDKQYRAGKDDSLLP